MIWLCRKLRRPSPEQDREFVARAEKVAGVSASLKQHRKENGLGKLFDDALHAPPKEQGG